MGFDGIDWGFRLFKIWKMDEHDLFTSMICHDFPF